MTGRELVLTLLGHLPLLRADVAVLLCGQDQPVRTEVAKQVMLSGGADKLILSGGRVQPPEHVPASSPEVFGELLGAGIPHDRIAVEATSQHTGEQAVNVLGLEGAEEWKRVLLIASPYHIPRAFLTFLAELDRLGRGELTQLLPVSAAQAEWWGSPPGVEDCRVDLLCREMTKIDAHAGGDCATWERAASYLRHWDGR